MAKKEITQTAQTSDKKLRTKDLIYAGAFGAIYIVLMLIVVLGTSAIPILYIVAPFTVGVVCATVYELCVLKVHKFGAALILGVLFALVACSGNVLGMVLAILQEDVPAVLPCLQPEYGLPLHHALLPQGRVYGTLRQLLWTGFCR